MLKFLVPIMAMTLLAADAGGGGADPKTEAAKEEKTPEKAVQADPAKSDPSGPAKDPVKTDADPAKKISDLEQRLARIEGRAAELETQSSVLREASAAGVKDVEYFEFLAGRERQAKGDKFDLKAFAAGLKTSKPELFGQAVAATSTGQGGAPPATSTDRLAAIRTEIDAAQKAGDALKVLKLSTDLQQLAAAAAKK